MTVHILESEDTRGLWDWESLSPEEIRVFCIDTKIARALRDAYFRYEFMTGLAHPPKGRAEGRQAEQDRADYAGRYGLDHPPGTFDRHACMDFMHEVCGLPVDQAMAWIMKMDALNWRFCLMALSDAESSDVWKARAAHRQGQE